MKSSLQVTTLFFLKSSKPFTCLRFYPAEEEIWTFLSAQENKQGFLKDLISREMSVASSGPVHAGSNTKVGRAES